MFVTTLTAAWQLTFIFKGKAVAATVAAERFNFTGIGLYPNNGTPFIHVDMRTTDPLNVQNRWIAIGDPNNWTYIPLNEENIRKYVV
jgi:hypothetical protein